ncbi:MAG: NAD(P)/FAD-dependent oxidoreductase [Anaerolineaceae bacterium]|jgi:FADH2 O2-dependent halogenase|nr:MAG: NAD(P)/FAD-dependent oxidoreductase [Anaerolineaceae bacterium]
MANEQKKFDAAIIGSGIGGSTLAGVLARQGLSVIVFEGGTHPKFAVGESMILETSEMMRALAEFYDVPELAYFSSENYFKYAGGSHGVKRHFSFVHHSPGQEQDIKLSLQAVIPKQPYGHEMHLYRQDTDYFLTSLAISYGATVLQNTLVADVDIQPDGVTISTKNGQAYHADYLVDAGGFRSLVADKLGWRHHDLQTHTRSIFTHMIDVPCYNDVSAPPQAFDVPFRWSEGTLHHIFKGGWLWIIPFNNHADSTNPLCSIGLQLDPRVHPARPDLSPEAEFNEFIERFPKMKEQLQNAKAVRGWVRAERLQFSSRHVVGDRFALLGHAAGFIDPLYSKGLYVTHISVMVIADLLLKAKKTNDYSAQAFQPLEKLTLNYVAMHDRLVANSIKSWSHYELWRVYAVLWLLGAYLEYLMLSITRMRSKNRGEYISLLKDNRLAGGGFKRFFEIQEKIDALFEQVNPEDEADVARVVAEARALFASFRWLPKPFQAVLDGKTHLPKNKFRLSLFNQRDGFMGDGEYRKHFFGGMSLLDLGIKGAIDAIRYSKPYLNWKRRSQNRLAWKKSLIPNPSPEGGRESPLPSGEG